MSIEKELADMMMGALATDLRDDLKQPDVPLSEQIRTLKSYLNTIPIGPRKTIAQIPVVNGYKHLYKDSPEGVTIDLDKLPAFIIGDMYEQVMANKN